MLRRYHAALVVIDVQERLLPFIHESERLIKQVSLLISGFRVLGEPILVTEQYRKGIGPTDQRIVAALTGLAPGEALPAAPPEALPARTEAPPFDPIEKMTFSCAAHEPFMQALRALDRKQVLLCGIESHVCVLQTALHLREAGFEVFLAADAVSSRSPLNVEIALRRMEQAGVQLTSVEMAIFEMLHQCGTPEFKAWSRLIK
jgi:nicotinamidase-related amidase